MTTQILRAGHHCGSSLSAKLCPCSCACPPREECSSAVRSLRHLQISGRSSRSSEDTGTGSIGPFPTREMCQGWGIREAVTYSHCFAQASAELTPILIPFKRRTSKHFTVSPPVPHSFSPFLSHILWVMHAFIAPYNFTHRLIRREGVVSFFSEKNEKRKSRKAKLRRRRGKVTDTFVGSRVAVACEVKRHLVMNTTEHICQFKSRFVFNGRPVSQKHFKVKCTAFGFYGHMIKQQIVFYGFQILLIFGLNVHEVQILHFISVQTVLGHKF